MVSVSASRQNPRRAAAAFHQRLSRRDVRDLAHLTSTLKAAGALAFERHGVVVHLARPISIVDFERTVGVPAARGAEVPAADGECVRPAQVLTPRQQKRRERGQRLAQHRKQRQQQQQQKHSAEQQQKQLPDEERFPEQADGSKSAVPPVTRQPLPSTCPREQWR